MGKILKDWLTESNGTSFCPWNLAGIVAIFTMCYKFGVTDKPDAGVYQAFGIAVGAIILAIAGKRLSEHGEG